MSVRYLVLFVAAALSICELRRASWLMAPQPDSLAEPGQEELVLGPPPVEPVAAPRSEDTVEGRSALAYQFNAPIFKRPDGQAIIGITRRGERVAIARWVPGKGCKGQWYELQTGGYVCSALGFNTSPNPTTLPDEISTRAPAFNQPLPFDYGKIKAEDRPIFWRMPSVEEEALAQASGYKSSPVKTRSAGAMLVAIHRTEVREEDGASFVRTVRGHYLRASDVELKVPTAMHGEFLGEGASGLPLAFVFEDDAPLRASTGEPNGRALKYARFEVLGEELLGEEPMIRIPQGLIPRWSVRVARLYERPSRVPKGAQWVHVDLTEQVLVAYEGDRPVRATLVSSGKAGYEPPVGVFQIGKKYTTKTMSGDDDIDGSYEVDQVPWIMYYWGSLALHGAYWHDGFGTPRSHGCTNIPPIDAQWLFRWAEPTLPPGWHGAVGLDGPWLVVSRSADTEGSEDTGDSEDATARGAPTDRAAHP